LSEAGGASLSRIRTQSTFGAYILAADPTWLRSSLSRYYDILELLVISASATNIGWTGSPIPADDCVELAQGLDDRGVATILRGDFCSPLAPLDADTRQRQDAIDAIATLDASLDWILQIDTDEVLPSLKRLLDVIALAEEYGADAIEWPMRILYRRLRDGQYLQIVNADGSDHYEYPGPIAVRSGTRLNHARLSAGRFLRPLVQGDKCSLQIARPALPNEVRIPCLTEGEAILHNSWARSPAEVHRKISSWGHNQGLRSSLYFYRTWLPTPLRWRRMRDLHPFSSDLWPRLQPYSGEVAGLLDHADR
jgi:hypothetical protein